jgi:single-stranded DNA-binding protein
MQTGFGFADVQDDNGLPVGIVAFASLADELSKYRKGAMIRVSGEFKYNGYTNKQGEEVDGYQIVCDGIAGVKSAKGKYSVPKPKADQQQRNQATEQFYEDKISF